MVSGTNDLKQAVEHLGEFLRGSTANTLADSLRGQRPDLADLNPGTLREAWLRQLQREREAGPLGLTRERHRDDGTRAFIEHVMTQNQDWTQSRRFAVADGLEIRPPNFTSQ